MEIKNFTPHTINVYREEDVVFSSSHRKYFLKDGAKPVATLPSEGMLSAKIKYRRDTDINGIPIFSPQIESVDPIPEGDSCFFVVSALYVSAVQMLGDDPSRLLTVSNPVYENTENPRPVGCLGLNTHF